MIEASEFYYFLLGMSSGFCIVLIDMHRHLSKMANKLRGIQEECE